MHADITHSHVRPLPHKLHNIQRSFKTIQIWLLTSLGFGSIIMWCVLLNVSWLFMYSIWQREGTTSCYTQPHSCFPQRNNSIWLYLGRHPYRDWIGTQCQSLNTVHASESHPVTSSGPRLRLGQPRVLISDPSADNQYPYLSYCKNMTSPSSSGSPTQYSYV